MIGNSPKPTLHRINAKIATSPSISDPKHKFWWRRILWLSIGTVEKVLGAKAVIQKLATREAHPKIRAAY